MAFSFNWAGLVAPQVSPIKDELDLNAMGAALGKGLRGYRNRVAAEEYADALDRYRQAGAADKAAAGKRAQEILAEIGRLEQENSQLAAVIETPEQAQVQEPEPPQPVVFDPAGATPEQIKEIQGLIGTKADGVWGPKSQAAYDLFTSNVNKFRELGY